MALDRKSQGTLSKGISRGINLDETYTFGTDEKDKLIADFESTVNRRLRDRLKHISSASELSMVTRGLKFILEEQLEKHQLKRRQFWNTDTNYRNTTETSCAISDSGKTELFMFKIIGGVLITEKYRLFMRFVKYKADICWMVTSLVSSENEGRQQLRTVFNQAHTSEDGNRRIDTAMVALSNPRSLEQSQHKTEPRQTANHDTTITYDTGASNTQGFESRQRNHDTEHLFQLLRLLTIQLIEVTTAQKDSVDMSDEYEIKRYDWFMKWLDQVKSMSKREYYIWKYIHTQDQDAMYARNVRLFVASFKKVLDASFMCDGCYLTISGRHYRCLSCQDMDLCHECYTSDCIPEGHTENHKMIEMRYLCDNCYAYIVGTRFHCNVCDDFDLCLGCKHYGMWPDRHSAVHKMVKYPAS